MEFSISRRMDTKKIYYNIKNCSVKGTANITFGIAPVKICVSSDYNCIILKQSPLLKFINILPILNCETFTPFKIYKNDVCCGKGKHILLKPIFKFRIERIRYEIRHHSHNYISLMREDKQVALFLKRSLSISENRSYFVKCINEEGILDIIMLFCAFIDVMFYSDNKSWEYIKWDKTYVFNDKYADRIQWSP